MPYKGVDEKYWGRIEKCVAEVLEKNKGRENFDKSNAVAICIDSIVNKGEEQKTEGVELLPVTASDIAGYENLLFGGETELDELLQFKDALLCQVGINRNGDAVNEEGVEQLAESIRFMAVCNEHREKEIVGFMLNGRAVNKGTELRGSGIIFARRRPDVAADVRSGKKRISIEAVAESARCEECGQIFASTKMYCSHLKSKTATRWLSGLKARGIATVEHPAWETSFGDENNFVMIASDLDCGCANEVVVSVKEPTWIQVKAWVENRLKPVVEDATTEVISKGGTNMFEIVDGETLEEFKTRLELVAASELEAKETELKAAFEAEKVELKAGFEAREAELKAETDKVKVGFERALELGMNSEQATILAGLDEDAFVLFKQQQKEVKIEASDEEEVTTVEAGQLQGQVLSTTEVVDKPLSLQGMGEFLSGKIKGGK